MNKNPFVPQPTYTPQQPPLPPGPPPPQPSQPEYSNYWAAAPYTSQWTPPPPEQSALYANYGYGTQWQRQQQQQQLQQMQAQYPPPVPQPPPQPAYNPYQPTAGYPQQYVPQTVPPPPPPAPYPQQPQQFFQPHIPPQQQPQRHQLHHTPPQHLPPAKRQRFDGPNPSNNRQQPPPQPQFQAPPPPPPQQPRGGAPQGMNHVALGPRGMPGGRGGPAHRGGRGAPMSGSRGGMPGSRGRGGGSGFIGGAGNGSGGRGGGSSNNLRGHGSRGNFGGGGGGGQNRRGTGQQGSFNSGSSFRGGRGGAPNRPRHDASFGPRDGTSSTLGSNKKDENRRTLTDFKIVGLEIKDISWTWGVLPLPPKIEQDQPETEPLIVKEESLDDDEFPATQPDEPTESQPTSTPHPLPVHPLPTAPHAHTHSEPPPPPSRIRIYFHTPVTPDDARPIPHSTSTVFPSNSSSFTSTTTTTDARKGKRKKLEDEEEEEDPVRLPPQMRGVHVVEGASPGTSVAVAGGDADRSSVALTETASEDWLMAAIVEGEEEDAEGVHENGHEKDVEDEEHENENEAEDDQDRLHVTQIVEVERDESEDPHPKQEEEKRSGLSLISSVIPVGADGDGDVHMWTPEGGEPVPEGDEAKFHGESVGVGVGDVGVGVTPTPASSTESLHPEGVKADTSAVAVSLPASPDPHDHNHITAEPFPPPASAPPVLVSVPVLSGASSAHVAVLGGGGGGSGVAKDTHTHTAQQSLNVNAIPSFGGEPLDATHDDDDADADHVALSGAQVLDSTSSTSTSTSTAVGGKSLFSVSAEPTLVNITTHDGDGIDTQAEAPLPTTINGDAHSEHEHEEETQTQIPFEAHLPEHLPEPPASPPTSTTLLSTSSASAYGGSPTVPVKPAPARTPSANRLSISYAGGNRRLVVDAEAVESLRLFRQEGRIEVVVHVIKEGEDGIKGVLVEGLSDLTKSYLPLQTICDDREAENDDTLPPFSKVAIPSSLTLRVYLDTARPLSEPKWAKSGDIQEWLKSMFGRMFWVAGDAAEGWEKKIQVVDPDPPPTIWTVLDGWAANSPAGVLNERQRFLKTHMTETDNILEILLRLVRGERATASYQSGPAISAPSISGPLLSALSQGSAHGAQQTHVSLAVLAMFRMTVEYAKKAVGDKGKAEVEERMGEIIRCLPSHLVYKSLDGIFKEWRVEKKGRGEASVIRKFRSRAGNAEALHDASPVKRLANLALPRSTTMFRNTYDSDNTVFSPQGRLHQVEYALEAVKQGSAAVGLRSKTHSVLLALKRSTGELASYQQKMFRIDDHVGIAIAGLTSDARVLSNFMRQQAMSSKMIFNRPIPVNRLVSSIADKAQVNTQEYGRRPYGVGFLVIGQDQTGPHLYEFSPSGNSYEYYAMSIGARSQSAKTYLEKHYESFADASLEDLIRHGLYALRETLQQDKELNTNNTSIGVVGPAGANETNVPPSNPFRILESDVVQPFLDTMVAKTSEAGSVAAVTGGAAPAADEDVQMAE